MTHEATLAAHGDARHTLPVRLGVIDYLNCVPVYDWLLGQMASDGFPWYRDSGRHARADEPGAAVGRD